MGHVNTCNNGQRPMSPISSRPDPTHVLFLDDYLDISLHRRSESKTSSPAVPEGRLIDIYVSPIIDLVKTPGEEGLPKRTRLQLPRQTKAMVTLSLEVPLLAHS